MCIFVLFSKYTFNYANIFALTFTFTPDKGIQHLQILTGIVNSMSVKQREISILMSDQRIRSVHTCPKKNEQPMALIIWPR